MNQLIRDLCFFCTEHMEVPKDHNYQKTLDEVLSLEEKLKEQIGYELLTQYQCTVDKLYDFESDAIFLKGMRLGAQLMAAIFPQSSDTTSTP